MSKKQFIEVAFTEESLDSEGHTIKSDIKEDLKIEGIENIRTSELYYFEKEINSEQLEKITSKVFVDPLIQKYSVNKNLFEKFNYFVEVKLHNDVTDNVGIIAEEGIKDYTSKEIGGKIRTAKRYYIEGNISKETVEKIAKEFLANEVIENFEIEEGKK